MIKTYMTDKELEINLNYISIKHERDYWRAIAKSLKNSLELEKNKARLEVASVIYEQLQEHSTSYVKKWIKNKLGDEVTNKFYINEFNKIINNSIDKNNLKEDK